MEQGSGKITTSQLQAILNRVEPEDFGEFLEGNAGLMIGDDAGAVFIKQKLKEKDIQQKELFVKSGIPERYGYKLLRGEKRTKIRDVILRLCIAAGLSLKDTQTALNSWALPELYPKKERDAAIIIAINRRFKSIEKTNEFLQQYGLEKLQECGVRDTDPEQEENT